MWRERKKIVGESFNPFTQRYEKVYDLEQKEKIWVAPKGHDKKIQKTNIVAIISGHIVEIKKYDDDVYYDYTVRGSKGRGAGKKKTDNKKRVDKINESKMNLRRLINANVNPFSKFVTLTFKENLTDIDEAKRRFKVFVRTLNRRRKKENKENLKYIYVVEFQERGAVHFHCVFFNMGFMKNEELQKIWGQGFTKVNRIKDVDNVGAYVVKYMQKDLIDDRLNGKDLYGRSRGLKEPVIIRKPSEVVAISDGLQKFLDFNNVSYVPFSKQYTTKYRGKIEYMQYNLKRIAQD